MPLAVEFLVIRILRALIYFYFIDLKQPQLDAKHLFAGKTAALRLQSLPLSGRARTEPRHRAILASREYPIDANADLRWNQERKHKHNEGDSHGPH